MQKTPKGLAEPSAHPLLEELFGLQTLKSNQALIL